MSFLLHKQKTIEDNIFFKKLQLKVHLSEKHDISHYLLIQLYRSNQNIDNNLLKTVINLPICNF